MVSIYWVFFWIVIAKFKHTIADYPLQGDLVLGEYGNYMLLKFKETGWEKPLALHCAVHALFTFLISICFLWPIGGILLLVLPLPLAALDFGIHFGMDRLKASPFLMGRWKNFTKDGYDFIQAGFFPPNLAQLELPTQGNYHQPYLTPKRLGPGDKEKLLRGNTLFWNSLGIDQLVHGLTDTLVLFILFLVVIS